MNRCGRLGVIVTLALAASTPSRPARAQGSSDAAAAEALFNEAQRLATSGKYAEACPKYAESLRLDSGIGVMLFLADCWERTGKTASAWAQFREAQELATQRGDKRAAAAQKRADRLEPNLARLIIRVGPGVDVPGLDVRRDTTDVGRAQWGVAVPVDPGPHTIVATATGKKPESVTVTVPAGTTPTTLELAALQDADATATPGPPTPPSPLDPTPSSLPTTPPTHDDDAGGLRGQRLLGVIVGGVGVAGVAVGAYFGFDTISKNNASNTPGNCNGNQCSQNGLDLRSSAKSSGLVSTIAFAAGGALVAGGVVLYLTAPRSAAPASVGLLPSLDGRGGAAVISGSW